MRIIVCHSTAVRPPFAISAIKAAGLTVSNTVARQIAERRSLNPAASRSSNPLLTSLSAQHLCCCSPHGTAVQLNRVAWIRSFTFSQSRSANVPQMTPLTGVWVNAC